MSDENQKIREEALGRCLSRIDEEEAINAFVTVCGDRALSKCGSDKSGPLDGVVLGVKDNIHVAGVPSSAGTEALRNFVPEESSPVVKKLEAAGAVVIGKTGMHELAFGITSNNATFGPVRNPHDLSRISGGSSGGSAAAVASGQATAALGTDTGGSARIPAALTGIVGFRPTTGRYPGEETLQISSTRDTIGLITQSVDDAILIDREIAETNEVPEAANVGTLRIGVPRQYFYENLDPEVAELADQALKKMESAGITLVEENMTDVPALNEKVGFPLVLYETGQLIPQYLARYAPHISFDDLVSQIGSPDVAAVMAEIVNGAIPEPVYLEARDKFRPMLQQAYTDYFDQHRLDAVIFPTCPITARPIDGILDGVNVNGELADTFLTYIRNADPASNAGFPSISIPASKTVAGLHVGMELDARAGHDLNLLGIAKQLEVLFKD